MAEDAPKTGSIGDATASLTDGCCVRRQSRAGQGRSSLVRLPCAAFAQALAPELDAMGGVKNTVQDRVGQGGVTHDVVPSRDRSGRQRSPEGRASARR